MMKSVCVVLFVLISGFIVSCTNVPGEIPVVKDPTVSSHFVSVSIPDAKDISDAVQSLKQYSDSANLAWTELDQVNTEKLDHIRQLIAELDGRGTAFLKEKEQIKQLLLQVKSNQLMQASQFNNTSLHQYDELTDSLSIKTLHLYVHLKSKGKSKPAMTRLVESIQQDEVEVRLKRAQYNEAAKKYNDFFWEKRIYLLQARGELPARPIRACFREKV